MSMHCFIIIALLYVILTVPYASEFLLISNQNASLAAPAYALPLNFIFLMYESLVEPGYQNATPATKIIPWLTLLLSTQGPWQKCCGVKSMIFVFQM